VVSKPKAKKAKQKPQLKKRTAVTIKRKAVKEGEIVPKQDGSLSLQRVPTLADAEEMVRRYDERRKAAYAAEAAHAKARAELLADPKYKAMVKRQKPVAATCKPENPREARAWLRAIAEHIKETIKTYSAHEPPAPVAGDDAKSYAAVRMRRDQWLADRQRLWWFFRAVKVYGSKKNKKNFGQLLGLPARQGRPPDQDRRNKILEKLLKIVQLRREGRLWKQLGQAARKLHDRELSNLAEARAKGIAARMKQKPSRIGEAKARNEALVKEIRAHNRRARLKQKPR
jgi:hypothetical protein